MPARPPLALGLNTRGGEIVFKAVADAVELPYTSLDQVLSTG